MRTRYIILYCLLLCISLGAFAQAPTTEFIENKGQWGNWFRFKARTLAGDMFLEEDGFRYALYDDANVAKVDSFHHGQLLEKPTLKFHVYKMVIEGGKKPEIIGTKQQANYYNYFLGNDSTKWKSGIHPYLGLTYNHIYDGIDMHVSSENTALVYEFFVQPGADANNIKLRFDGVEKMYVNHKGNLVINTSVGQVTEMKPYVYQYINDEKVEVACNYHLEAHTLSFDMPDGYDHSKLLVIDPVTLWASFTGSTADNWGFTATYDDAGNFYMGGIVNCLAIAGGGAYPVSPGAYQVVWGGGVGAGAIQFASDYGIMKLSPDGVSRIYATYIGGTQNERPHSMIVDGSGNLIIAGRSLSPNFPVTAGAFQSTKNSGWDIVVTKLNNTGTALLASTFLGGSGHDGVNFDSTELVHAHLKYNYGDDARSEVQVDNAGNVYVAGNTQSFDFPVTPTAIASTMTGIQAGVVFKLNPTMTSLLWSTYLDGSGDDAGYVLAFNPAQTSLYVGGATNSTNFPVPSAGGWLTTYQGDSADGYILRFRNSAPYNIEAGTFVGTSHYDQVYGLQVDDAGNVYAMGLSLGGTFPVTPGVYTNPNSCQFVIKLNANLTTNLISTVYGSGDPTKTNISPVAFLVDTCNNVYVSGWGGNIMAGQPGVVGLTTVGNTTGMPIPTPLPGETIFQPTTDGFDFYFIVLGPNMTTLRYATFYGRNEPGFRGEHVDGGTSRFDKRGVVYQGICANCGGNPLPPAPHVEPFPTTPGVWADSSMSTNCNQAALKIAFNIGPVTCNITAGPSTSGCAPLTVNFVNTTTNGLTFLWNFGDGSPTVTTFAPTHTYTAGGTFTVTLTSTNENACFKTTDTAFLIISVDTNKLHPDFTYQITDSCGPFIAAFTNTSTTNITTGAPTYVWHFGDGATFAGDIPPPHNYADTGYYTVMLIMSHPDACKTPDTVQKKIHIFYTLVSAEAELPDTLCLGATFRPTGGMKNATSVNWTFGDGGTSTETLPSYKYMAPGTYTVTVVAANPGTCNGADTVVHIITVISGPIADFIFIPVKPEANIPTTFTNKSINATHYSWDFGDNTNSTEVNPVHQYKKTGNFKVCLTAMNESTCPAVACKTVPTEVVPLLGLPTGFSPNGDGQNDILYVRGAAIETMHLRIYNRWGQLVFESKSQDIGWDGTFGGEPQPIEAYGYVLEATFIDGTSRLLKGNITLLR
ncbi:MAG: PKD domain-containing protein [Taibaiella sp.]|nr:PKD domain-containing protein [Taibaiella sp.]